MNRALLRGGIAALALASLGCPSSPEPPDAGTTQPDAAACVSQCGDECCLEGEVCNVSTLRCEGPCTPSCAGRLCGDDGCGGSCGACGEGTRCEEGACIACQADCLGKECGWDGCSGSCGTCPQGFACTAQRCVPEDPPDAGVAPDGGGEDAGLPGLSLAEFCSQLVDLQISRSSECNSGALAAWAALISKPRQCETMQSAVGGGRAIYEPSGAAACLGWYQSASCEQILSYPQGNPCESVVVGQVALGGECYGALDCAEGYCPASPQTCPARCTAYVLVGEACSATDLCPRGTSCAAGVCRPVAGLGDPCGGPSGVMCAYPNYYCEGPTAAEPGTCRSKKTSGTCSQMDACSPLHYCEGLVLYPPESGTCAAKRKVGESCVPGAQACELYSYCADSGACTLWGGVGETCGLVGTEYANCLASWCPLDETYQGVCAAFKAPGETCVQEEWGACSTFGACDAQSGRCLPACMAP